MKKILLPLGLISIAIAIVSLSNGIQIAPSPYFRMLSEETFKEDPLSTTQKEIVVRELDLVAKTIGTQKDNIYISLFIADASLIAIGALLLIIPRNLQRKEKTKQRIHSIAGSARSE